MTPYKARTFKARLQSGRESLQSRTTPVPLHWITARVPFDMAKVWPEHKSRRVRGTINGFEFRTSLFPEKGTNTFMMLVNKKTRDGAKVKPGETVQITLEPDLDTTQFELPMEFARVLRGERALRKYFSSLTPSMQKGFSYFINQAKAPETRRKRSEQMAEALYLAMEGELEPPPILRAAFQRQPLALEGWNCMTPIMRRNHLLGIFFRQTPQGREQRARMAIDDALRVARRKRGTDADAM